MTPTIGRIVHFVEDGGAEWPAIVSTVITDGVLDLHVFRYGDSVIRHSVRQGEAGDRYTWHWPEFVAAAAAQEVR